MLASMYTIFSSHLYCCCLWFFKLFYITEYHICMSVFRIFLFFLRFTDFYYKFRYTEVERRRGRSSIQWFTPQWLKLPALCQSEGTCPLLRVSHMGAGSQGFGPSSTAFSGAGWEEQLPELEPEPIWDPGMFNVRASVARPWHQALYLGYFT